MLTKTSWEIFFNEIKDALTNVAVDSVVSWEDFEMVGRIAQDLGVYELEVEGRLASNDTQATG